MNTTYDDLSDDSFFVLHLNTARTWRGGERQVFFLASEIQHHGGRQLVVGQPGSELEKRCLETGLPFRGIRMGGEWDFPAAAKIARLVRETGANILHAHTAKAHTMGLLARRKLAGSAASDQNSNSKFPGGGPKLLVSRRVDFPARLNFLSRRKYQSPLVDLYIAISDNVKRILTLDGIAPEKIRIAYSGIDLVPFNHLPDASPLRQEFQLAENEIVLGNVAALVDHKDQHTLIRAFAHMAAELGPAVPVRLFIMGEGKLRGELEALARAEGVAERIEFTGFRDDVPVFLSLFDLFVMSSKEEGLGTAVLDAMASALPVAATRGGGIPEMIDHEKGGLLADVGDHKTLGDHLARLVYNVNLRKEMGAYNHERVKDFSIEQTFRSTIDVYREVLS